MVASGAEADAEEVSLDGRVQRGARSREAILNAVFDLIGKGFPQPTAEQVAELAGVRVRTVFRHFDDMESLHVAMTERLRAEVRPLFSAIPLEGALEERVANLIRGRAEIYERIGPYKRSGNTQRWRYEYLQESHEAFVRDQREHLLRVLPELRDAPGPLASGLELVTSFEAWDRLRTDQRLGVERAAAAMQRSALALLEAMNGTSR